MSYRTLPSIFFLAAAALLADVRGAKSESWTLLHMDETNWSFLDVDSIERNGQSVTAWQVDIPRVIYYRGDVPISHFASQGRRECLATTVEWMQSAVIGYDGANLGGSTSPTDPIRLGAEGAQRMKALCSPSEFGGPRFATLDEVLARFRLPLP